VSAALLRLFFGVVGHNLVDTGKHLLMSGEPGHIASGDQVRIVRELGAEQAAVTMADRGDDTATFEDLPSDSLQAVAVEEILHNSMSAGKEDSVEVGRVDLVGTGSVIQQCHECRVGRTATLSLSCQSWGVSAIAAPGVSSPRPG
jgi:hypothetical protein